MILVEPTNVVDKTFPIENGTPSSQSHKIHVGYIYLHLPEKNQLNVGKSTVHGPYGNDNVFLG